MSKIALSGNASGTGTFTIASPNSSTDRTLNLPDAAGTIQVSGNPISGTTGSFSGDLSFNSGYGSAAVAYGCRSWVNFNGTGTVAIRASGNVSSITDNGTGDYTVNFTTAMPDENYSISGFARNGRGSSVRSEAYGISQEYDWTYTTTAVRIYVFDVNAIADQKADTTLVSLNVFR
jgi:hypothetical protein